MNSVVEACKNYVMLDEGLHSEGPMVEIKECVWPSPCQEMLIKLIPYTWHECSFIHTWSDMKNPSQQFRLF
jgi:hypothetical protein